MTAAPLDARRRRLLFRAAHRGTHEADLLVGGFVAVAIQTATGPDLAALEAMIELPDGDLVDWACGRRPIPEDGHAPMLRRLRDAALSGAARR